MHTLFRAPLAGYVMPCSGNDVLLSSTVVASPTYYFDHASETVLAYGRELEPANPEPRLREYTFSVPGRRWAFEALDALSIAN